MNNSLNLLPAGSWRELFSARSQVAMAFESDCDDITLMCFWSLLRIDKTWNFYICQIQFNVGETFAQAIMIKINVV